MLGAGLEMTEVARGQGLCSRAGNPRTLAGCGPAMVPSLAASHRRAAWDAVTWGRVWKRALPRDWVPRML